MKDAKYVVFRSSALPPVVFKEEHDFLWSTTDEPHCHRRKELIKKYPEIQALFGPDPATKFICIGIVLLQLICAWMFRDMMSFKTPLFWIVAYFIGATSNHALFLAIHELSHNLGFKSPLINKLFSIMVCNVPIAFPYAASFKLYHSEHHKFQGVEGMDTDLPTRLEGLLFSTTLGKLFFATFQILFYAIRPMAVRFQRLTSFHFLNIVYIFAFDFLLFWLVGPGALVYLLASTLLAGSALHPCAAHFFAEHYVFTGVTETYSYYGILNMFCFNVGYHNEHHDFPNIPGSRLPALRKIAGDYYNKLPRHDSWVMVSWRFVSDPKVSPWNRVKRLQTSDDD